jgi:hypothetical protein
MRFDCKHAGLVLRQNPLRLAALFSSRVHSMMGALRDSAVEISSTSNSQTMSTMHSRNTEFDLVYNSKAGITAVTIQPTRWALSNLQVSPRINSGCPRNTLSESAILLFSYSQYQVGWYIQDDYRVKKNLTVSYGVRQELQTNGPGKFNLAPRLGFVWSPLKKRKRNHPWRLRNFLRLAQRPDLRTNPACRRTTSTRSDCGESGLSQSLHRRNSNYSTFQRDTA